MWLALAIKSCNKHFDRRQAQRETWLKRWSFPYFFIVGNNFTTDRVKNLLWELDVWSVPASDSFSDIAPKVRWACELLGSAQHLVVIDDDTYLYPDRFAAYDFVGDYIGFMRTWGLDYNRGIPYAQGSCFVLSSKACGIVAQSSEMVPGVIDDGAVGRALINKVPFTHEYRFWPGPDFSQAPAGAFSTHKCDPNVMRRLG